MCGSGVRFCVRVCERGGRGSAEMGSLVMVFALDLGCSSNEMLEVGRRSLVPTFSLGFNGIYDLLKEIMKH